MTTHSSSLIHTHTYIHDYWLLWLGTHTYTYTWLLTPLGWYTHTHIYMTTDSSGLIPICVCRYQARGVSSHVYVCVCTKPEEWVVMYICVCGYQDRGVSSHDTDTHIYTWLLTPLAWYPHTHIYMTTHSSSLIPTHTHIHDNWPFWLDTHTRGVSSHVYIYMCGYQARGVSSHVYICVCTKPEEWVVMYIYVCVYQAKGVSSHVYICVCVPSQRSE
jgi:hypothetical protein